MTTIHEVQQSIWLDTPLGVALVKFVVDRGPDSDLEWVTILQETGECMTFDNSEVKASKNYTLGRRTGWANFRRDLAARRRR